MEAELLHRAGYPAFEWEDKASLKAMRLKGEYETAERLSATFHDGISPTVEEIKEWEWEKICRETQKTGNIGSLVKSVQRHQSHHHISYLIEAFLWACAVQSREWMKNYPSLRQLGRNPQLKLKSKNFRNWSGPDLIFPGARRFCLCKDIACAGKNQIGT